MKYVILLAVVVASVSLVRSDVSSTSVKSADGHNNYQHYQYPVDTQQQQQTTDNDYYAAASNYRNYQNPTPANPAVGTGYYNYYNPYYPGLNYNQLGSHQKQDLTDLFSFNNNNNNNSNDLFNGGADAGEIGGTVTGVIAAIAAALGLKGVTKLGLYLAGFFGLFLLLLIIPTVLGIVGIALAATQNNDNNKDGGMMNMLKQMLGKDDGRGLAHLNTFLNSEECVERISCAISQKTYGRFYGLKQSQKKKDDSDNITLKEEPKQISNDNGAARSTRQEKPGFMQRISRGLKAENCKAYKCSVMSYFS